MSIDKLAQKRNPLHKAREFVFEPSTKTLTKRLENHVDDFAQFLVLLRKQDDKARDLMLGKDGKYKGTTMRSMIDTARELMFGRDYINSAGSLSKFFETLEDMSTEFAKLDGTLIKSKNQTLLQHISDDTLQNMLTYYEKHSKASNDVFGFKKQASVFDWFKDQFDHRRRAMKFLEKRFPEIAKFRKDLEAQVNNAEELLHTLSGHFDKLSKARAESDVNAYQAILSVMDKDISKAKNGFNTFFVKEVGPYILWYRENIKKVTPEQEATVKPEEKTTEPEITKTDEPAGTTTAPAEPTGGYYDITSVPDPGEAAPSNVFQMRPSAPAILDKEEVEPTQTKLKMSPMPVPPKKEEKVSPPGGPTSPLTGQKLPTKPPGRVASGHDDFITKIASMDEEDMRAIGQAILEYSEELEDQDPIASIKLMAVAEALL